MDDDQMMRIDAFLKNHGLDTGSIPKQRIKQLQKIDNALQKRLDAISKAQRMLRENSITIAAIASDSGITRKTFYNNKLLKQYVESFMSVDGEPGKLVKASEIEKMKEKLERQADDIAKMIARDIDVEGLRYELDEMKKVIDIKDRHIQNLTELYDKTLDDLHQERAAKRTGFVVSFPNKEA